MMTNKESNQGSGGSDKEEVIESRGMQVWMKKRDWKMLLALERWGVLGLGQLHGLALLDRSESADYSRLFFNDTERRDYWTRLAKRLVQLSKAGLIQIHFYENYPKLFTLGKRGHEVLKRRNKARFLGYRKSISLVQAEHEIVVNGVGLLLTELLGLEIRTERERYVWSGHGGWSPAPERVPIADLWIVDPVQPKAIEVELIQKSELRYRDIWRAYRSRLRSKAVVLYLTSWPSGVRCLLAHAARFEADFIYVCGLKEFRESQGRHPFLGYRQGQQLVLNSRAIPNVVAPAYQRVPPASLSARPGFAGPGERLAAGTFASPSQPLRVGRLTPSLSRQGQGQGQFVPPLESRIAPHPLPLHSPSPAPEGETQQPTDLIGGLKQ